MTTERTRVPYAADERTTLLAFLDWHRDTLRLKCDGLSAEQLNTPLPPSDLTLGGMVKHLAYVEDWWFGVNLEGRDPMPPFDDVDWEADADWDWHSAAQDSPAELWAGFDRAVAASARAVAEATSLGDLAQRRHPRTGEGLSLRWIVIHMIEEYARHLGHADLIRESIDGVTGS